MPTAIIIGASSGIGATLARQLTMEGWTLGLMARRVSVMEAMSADFPEPVHIRHLDLRDYDQAVKAFQDLLSELASVDLVVANAGINYLFPDAGQTEEVIRVNVLGLVGCMELAKAHFIRQGHGHLVCITSIAGIRGSGPSPVYGASKAFLINYLEGLRKQMYRKGYPIHVTDIRPGYVATDMTDGQQGLFWLTPLDRATTQIRKAIAAKKEVAYISPRWQIIARVMQMLPFSIYKRVGG